MSSRWSAVNLWGIRQNLGAFSLVMRRAAAAAVSCSKSGSPWILDSLTAVLAAKRHPTIYPTVRQLKRLAKKANAGKHAGGGCGTTENETWGRTAGRVCLEAWNEQAA